MAGTCQEYSFHFCQLPPVKKCDLPATSFALCTLIRFPQYWKSWSTFNYSISHRKPFMETSAKKKKKKFEYDNAWRNLGHLHLEHLLMEEPASWAGTPMSASWCKYLVIQLSMYIHFSLHLSLPTHSLFNNLITGLALYVRSLHCWIQQACLHS